jgi:hypothetical protein
LNFIVSFSLSAETVFKMHYKLSRAKITAENVIELLEKTKYFQRRSLDTGGGVLYIPVEPDARCVLQQA